MAPNTGMTDFFNNPGFSTELLTLGAPVPAPVAAAVPNMAAQMPLTMTAPTATVPGMATPGAAAGGTGWFNKMGGLEGLGSIAQGLASLGQVWAAIQGVGIARDQLDFSKKAFNKNLANQTKSYNTALEDKVRARYFTEGRSASDVDTYLAQNRL